MDQSTIVVLIILAAVIIGLAVFLVLRKSGGSFTAKGKHGKTEVSISTESNQPEASLAGQITIKGATAKRGSIEAATDKGGKIDLEDAAAERDVRASTTGSDPPPPRA